MKHEEPSADDSIAALERAAQRHEAHFEGRRVVWRRFGEGAPVVLLHGGHGDWLHWSRNIAVLATHHAVWVPDMPGYGESDDPRQPTLESIVAATSATLDSLVGARTPVALVGFSFGALVATHLAMRRGAISRLVLVGPAGHGGARRPRGDLRPWRRAHERRDLAALREVMRHNLLMHMLRDDASADDLALRIHTDACLRARFRSKPISRSGGLVACLAGYAGPTLLVWGEHDVTAEPTQAALALCQGRADRRSCIVPGAGHWAQFERADTINALLLEWLGGCPVPGI